MGFQSTLSLDWGEKRQDDFSVTRHTLGEYEAVPMHWHDCFELFFLTEGERFFTAGETTYRLTAGDILLLPPHIPHSADASRHGSITFGYAESVIYTPGDSFVGLRYLLPFRGAPARLLGGTEGDTETIRALLRAGADICEGQSPVRMLEMHAVILRLHGKLWELYVGAKTEPDSAYRYITEVQEYIEAHLAEDISPYAVAEALHISHTHLCRLCRRALRRTPTQLILDYRLSFAQQLLREHPDMPVTEVAARVGFADSCYFIRCFRREMGIPPGKFRHQSL